MEIRVFGPPGCGKTTWTSRQIENAARKYGSDAIFVASFTRAAAAELVGRNLPIDERAIGTLHSHCFRALGSPEIAELNVKQFNEEHGSFRLSSAGAVSVDEGAADQPAGDAPGDEPLAIYNVLRNRLAPRELWPDSVAAFARAWEGWKGEAGYRDFTDLIEFGVRDMLFPPNRATIGFIDEAQDLTPLQWKLVRDWGTHCDFFIVAGDDDQCIYEWAGASPDSLLDPPVPDKDKRVLNQSWRVPAVVQAAALRWISKVERRQPKEYKPRDHDGEIRLCNGTYRKPKVLLDDARQYICEGKTVMFLASCSFQLGPLLKHLREEGIPYHNPYRRSRSDWNPLAPRKGVSSANRLAAFLQPAGFDIWLPERRKTWTLDQLAAWTEACASQGFFKRGAKTKFQELAKATKEMSDEQLRDATERLWIVDLFDYFQEEALEKAFGLDLDWFRSQLSSQYGRRMDYPLEVCRSYGVHALAQEPLVIVGTIHSVKGGQADVVYLLPDISLSSYKGATRSTEGRDAVIRQYYVGMTRCRETLVLCKPATQWAATVHKVIQ